MIVIDPAAQKEYDFYFGRKTDVGCSVSMAEVEDPAGTIWMTDSTNIELWREAYFDYAPPDGNNSKGQAGGVQDAVPGRLGEHVVVQHP